MKSTRPKPLAYALRALSLSLAVRFKRSLGLVCLLAQAASAATLYVDVNSFMPMPPYSDWLTAANNIQDAIDAASAGDQIIVNDGVYSTGGETVNNSAQTNRVAVNKAVTVQSVNGPNVTVIDGGVLLPGDDGVRCVYLASYATLNGFTLTDGSASAVTNAEGGGVWCESITATVSNCVIIGNNADSYTNGVEYGYGGGAYGGTLNNCTLGHNFANADGGGAYGSTLNNCVLTGNREASAGGGAGAGAAHCTLNNCALTGNNAGRGYAGAAYDCTLNNCTLTDNFCEDEGGGAANCTLNNCTLMDNGTDSGGGGGAVISTLNNCTLVGNHATAGGAVAFYCTLNNCTLTGNTATGFGDGGQGGGAYFDCTLYNCTLTGNSAEDGTYYDPTRSGFYTDPGNGGGAYGCTLNNCIAYYNSASVGTNYDSSSTLNYCCTSADPGGIGNITNVPLFVDYANGNLHLQSTSPCINAGDNAYAPPGPDLDGNPRIVGGTVDMGAYEYQTPSSILSYAWAQQYGLPTDGSADYADCDGTGMNNCQKSVAGLNPTNAASILAVLPPVATNNPSGLVVSWQSVDTRMYFLQCSTNLAASPAFSTIQSNIVGQVTTTSFMDTNAVGNGPFFYRVGVQ